MTVLTHQQVRYALHVGRESFDAAAQSELKQHLVECTACRTYAAELTTLQAGLSRVMRARWESHRPPVDSIPRIWARVDGKTAQRRVLRFGGSWVTTGVLAILAGVLIWMISVTGPSNENPGGQSAAGSASGSAVPLPTPVVSVPTPIPGLAIFGGNITLIDGDLAETRFLAGSTISLTLHWQAHAAMKTSYNVSVHVLDVEGNLVAQSDSIPGDGAHPTTNWLPGETVADQHRFVLPDSLATGRYELAAGVYDAANGARLLTDNGESIVRFATIDVQGISYRVGEDFDEFATLLGFDLASDRLAAGDAVELTLYWRARAQTATSYTVSVQVFGENKTIVAQADSVPDGGARPTTSWQPGEVIADRYTIRLPANLPPGEYRVVMGLYDSASGIRLSTPADNQSVVLATLQVE